MTPTSLRLVVPLHFGVGEKKKKKNLYQLS